MRYKQDHLDHAVVFWYGLNDEKSYPIEIKNEKLEDIKEIVLAIQGLGNFDDVPTVDEVKQRLRDIYYGHYKGT